MEILRTDEFAKWLKKLRDRDAKARINFRVRRIEFTGNLGDYKLISEGIGEIRIDCGPGYRLYFTRRNTELILLLIGGDKSSQQRDIKRAQELNRQYETSSESKK
jgi:putative addiction module killer protein